MTRQLHNNVYRIIKKLLNILHLKKFQRIKNGFLSCNQRVKTKLTIYNTCAKLLLCNPIIDKLSILT